MAKIEQGKMLDYLNGFTKLEIKCSCIERCDIVRERISDARTDIVIDNLIPKYCSKEDGGDCGLKGDYTIN